MGAVLAVWRVIVDVATFWLKVGSAFLVFIFFFFFLLAFAIMSLSWRFY